MSTKKVIESINHLTNSKVVIIETVPTEISEPIRYTVRRTWDKVTTEYTTRNFEEAIDYYNEQTNKYVQFKES